MRVLKRGNEKEREMRRKHDEERGTRFTEVRKRVRGNERVTLSGSRPGVSAKHYPAKKDNTPGVQYYNRPERKCIIENDR